MLGQQHRHVAGEIAVFAAARTLDHEAGRAQVGRQGGIVLQGLDRLQHQFAQLFFHGWGRFRDGTGNPNRRLWPANGLMGTRRVGERAGLAAVHLVRRGEPLCG